MIDANENVDIMNEDGVSIAILQNQRILDELHISQIGSSLADIIAQQSPPKLVLDFEKVTNMSSSALGMLITVHKRIREADGQLVLCNIHRNILEVFQITRLNEIFHIMSSRQEAVQSLA